MRCIRKGREPDSLTEHRCKTHADYDNYREKDELRVSLVREQRGLCCFCMSRIYPDEKRMKIAHWHSQTNYPLEQLDYHNLLGACCGGQGKPPEKQHCDTHQGDSDISRHPADVARPIENFVHFKDDGSICSDDVVFNNDLDCILNLNVAHLRNQRKGVLDALWETFKKRDLTRPKLEELRRIWNGEMDCENLKPYCQVIVYWLDKRLRRM